MSQSQYHVSKYIQANIFVILFLFFKTIIFVILVIWRQITLNQIINNAIYHKYRYVEVFLAFVLTKQKYCFAHYRIVFGRWPKGDFLNIFKSGWPLRNIHISNDNGSFPFYAEVFFLQSLPRFSPDLAVYE